MVSWQGDPGLGLMENMTWSEVEEYVKIVKTVIVPFGSTEEHGYHLPLSTDFSVAYDIGRRVAEKVDVLVTPPLNYGVCRSTAHFPGTITISLDTLRSFVKDIFQSLYNHGLKNFIFLPGHLGTAQLIGLELDAQELIRLYPDINIAIAQLPLLLKELFKELIEDTSDYHAGEIETSMMLAIKPELVRKDKAVSEHPAVPEHLIVRDPRRYMRSGVMGDATKASREKGERIMETAVEKIISLVKQMDTK